MAAAGASAGWRGKFAVASLALSIFAVAWFAIAALGSKFGLWGWQFGLGVMTIQWGGLIALAAGAIALIALIIGLIRSPRVRPVILALFALLIALMVLFRLQAFGARAESLPPIHDIQTDWSQPIGFSERLLSQRKADNALNPVEDDPRIAEGADERWPGMGGRRVAEVQEEAEGERIVDGETMPAVYAPIEPLFFDQSVAEVAGLASDLVEDRGWEIVKPAELGGGRSETSIEATVTSTWWGFRDDVAIRIRDEGNVTRLDMRSISRVGLSDLGANAQRVSDFLYEMEDRGNGRRTR